MIRALGVAPVTAGAFGGRAGLRGKDRFWKVALGLSTFAGASRRLKRGFPIWEVLDFASRLGFDGVELAEDWPMGPYPRAAETDRVRALARLYDGYGLSIFSLQCSAADASAPDATLRLRWMEEVRDRLELAKVVGAGCVRLSPSGGLRGGSLEEGLVLLGQSLGQAAEVAAKQGLVVAFEVDGRFVFTGEDHVMRVLEVAKQPNLKVVFDAGVLHVPRVGLKNVAFVRCRGAGPTDLKAVRAGGFRGWLTVEPREGADPYEACARAKREIDQALA